MGGREEGGREGRKENLSQRIFLSCIVVGIEDLDDEVLRFEVMHRGHSHDPQIAIAPNWRIRLDEQTSGKRKRRERERRERKYIRSVSRLVALMGREEGAVEDAHRIHRARLVRLTRLSLRLRLHEKGMFKKGEEEEKKKKGGKRSNLVLRSLRELLASHLLDNTSTELIAPLQSYNNTN